jgi:hypothetical protein
MRQDSDRLLWAGLDLLTLDLAEAAKYAKTVSSADAAFDTEVWRMASQQRKSLQKLRQSWPGESVASWIHELERLEKAAREHDTVETIAIAREAIAKGESVYHHAKDSAAAQDTLDALYHASVSLGQIAVICTRGVGEKVTPVGHLVARSVEAALLLKLLNEEEQQLNELSSRAYDRQKKRRELNETLSNLEQERERLEWARQRARG